MGILYGMVVSFRMIIISGMFGKLSGVPRRSESWHTSRKQRVVFWKICSANRHETHLITEHDTRFPQDRPSDSNPLPLAPGELAASLPHSRGVAPGLQHDSVMHLGLLGGGLDGFPWCPETAVADVVFYCVIKEDLQS